MRLVSVCLALVVVLLAAAPVRAQTDPALRRVVLTDGTVVVGTVADESADPVVVIEPDGTERRIPRARVAEITPLVNGRFFRIDPTRTRTVLAPTARTLGRHRTRVGLLGYILPNVTYGVTDRVDVSGTVLLLVGGGAVVLPVVGAKLTVVERPGVAAAVGTSVFVPLASGGSGVDDVNGAFAVLPYGVVTLGSEVAAVSLGATGVIGGDASSGAVAVGEGAVLSLGGEVQLNNGVKLLADLIAPVGAGSSGAVLLPGVRFFGDRYSLDLYAFVAFSGSDGSDVDGGGPVANFTFTF
jgi:hypothetical protein